MGYIMEFKKVSGPPTTNYGWGVCQSDKATID